MLPSVRKDGEQDSLITITCELYPTIISGTNTGPLWDWRGDGYSGANNKGSKFFAISGSCILADGTEQPEGYERNPWSWIRHPWLRVLMAGGSQSIKGTER